MEKKKKIWIAIGICTLIIGLFAINYFVRADKTTTVEVTTLQEEPITDTVIAQGILKLSDEHTVYYEPEKGEIAEILVNEGDDVETGTELIRYENNQLILEQKQNEIQLQISYLQLEDMRKKHKKIDELVEKHKDDEAIQEEHDQISLQHKQMNLEIQQLELQKEMIEKNLSDLVVRSKINGKVIEVNEDAQSLTQAEFARPIIRIGSTNKFIVEGNVSEYDALKIKEGQKVTLTADTVPDESWEGVVKSISYLPVEAAPAGDFSSGATTVQYTVIVEVLDKSINLKPGFNMIMEIVTAEYTANTLPITAVIQEEDKHFVYIVNDQGIVEKIEVKVGSATFETIEIKSGITKEQQVIINPEANIKEGMEVTVE